MTTNQIAFQANKIKAEENAIKRAAQDLKLSEHLHEYGYLKGNNDQSYLEGNKFYKDSSEVVRNYAQALGAFAKLF